MHEPDSITCIHCKKEWMPDDIETSFTYEYNNNEVTEYMCPGYGKIMNGCDTVTIS